MAHSRLFSATAPTITINSASVLGDDHCSTSMEEMITDGLSAASMEHSTVKPNSFTRLCDNSGKDCNLSVPHLSSMGSSPVRMPSSHDQFSLSVMPVSCDTFDTWLADSNINATMLVIDCRSFVEYNASHIMSALNVHCPSIVKRRNRGATLPLEYVVSCMNQRSRLQKGEIKRVIVYDQDRMVTPHVPLRDADITVSNDTSNTMVLVLRSLLHLVPEDALYYIHGGFNAFSKSYSHRVKSSSSPRHGSLSLATPGVCAPGLAHLHARTHSDSCLHKVGRHYQGEPVEIMPWLFLGDAQHATAKSLHLHGFTALLNVSCLDMGNPLPNITYKQIRVADDAEADLKTWFPEAVAFIDSVRTKHGKLLVHCRAGISRSATVCIAYLMYHKHFSLEQSHAYVKSRRNIIDPNFNFMQQLQEYEMLLSASRQSAAAASATATQQQQPQSPVAAGIDMSTAASSTTPSSSSILLPSPLTPVSSCNSQVFVFDSPLSALSPGICHSPLVSPS